MSAPLFYEDLEEGRSFVTESRQIDELTLDEFIELSGDRNPVHTDEAFAKSAGFPTRLIHGALVFSIATGLRQQTGLFAGSMIAMLELRSWRFCAPVFAGDTITVHTTIVSRRATSSPRRGIVVQAVEVLNQHEDIVQGGEMVFLFSTKLDHGN